MRENAPYIATGLAALVAAFFVPCGQPEEPRSTDTATQLRRAIAAECGDRGSDCFTLPRDLAEIPAPEGNPLTVAKVELGRALFHDSALSESPHSEDATHSCASCHMADHGFQAGVQQGIGDGGEGVGIARRLKEHFEETHADVQPVRSPSCLHGAYNECALWSGKLGGVGPNADLESPEAIAWVNALGLPGLETQAIFALTPHRMLALREDLFERVPEYKPLYEAAFPGDDFDDMEQREFQIRTGLAMAAYERTLMSDRAPFQRWLRGEARLTEEEMRGGITLFSQCVSCHSHPGFGSDQFHDMGFPDLEGPRVIGVGSGEGRGEIEPERAGEFKVPQLYNLADSAFYGHGGTFTTIESVIEAHGIDLSESELSDVTAFVRDALRDAQLRRYEPSRLPSGACFPADDPLSRELLECQ